MKVPRSNHSLVVVQGKIVAIGGYQGSETTWQVEVLDVETNRWNFVDKLPSSRSALSFVEVDYNSLEEGARKGLRWKGEVKFGGKFKDEEDEDSMEMRD